MFSDQVLARVCADIRRKNNKGQQNFYSLVRTHQILVEKLSLFGVVLGR